jgi:hypothetical protein
MFMGGLSMISNLKDFVFKPLDWDKVAGDGLEPRALGKWQMKQEGNYRVNLN